MLRKLFIGLASAAALTGVAVTPGLAMIPQCMETPDADTCPYAGAPTPKTPLHDAHHALTRHAYVHRHELLHRRG